MDEYRVKIKAVSQHGRTVYYLVRVRAKNTIHAHLAAKKTIVERGYINPEIFATEHLDLYVEPSIISVSPIVD